MMWGKLSPGRGRGGVGVECRRRAAVSGFSPTAGVAVAWETGVGLKPDLQE